MFNQLQIKRLIYLMLYALYERGRVLLVALLVVPVLVIAIGLSSQKYYVNHATILIEESALLNPFLDDLSFSFELSDRMEALQTLVLSRKVLSSIAKDTQLVNESASDIEIDRMQQKLSEALSFSMVGDELVRIHFKWTQREQMKPVLEQVVEHFIQRLLAPTKASLDTSERFFAEQLNSIRSELERAEDKLAEFKSSNRQALPELLSSNQDSLKHIEKQKQLKHISLSGAKARLETLTTKLGKANPVLGVLEDKIIRLESEVALLRTRYTDKHSRVQSSVRELQNLKLRQNELMSQNHELDINDIDKLWQVANTLPGDSGQVENSLLVSQLITLQEAKNQVSAFENEIKMLDSQIEVITTRIAETNQIEKQLRQLERDYDVKQTLYKDMLSRYEMAKVTGKLVRYEGPDKVKTIERAYSPTRPINHSILIICLIGIVLGLLTGATLIFVTSLLDLRITSLATIEKLTGKPVLTTIPDMTQQDD